MTCECRLERIMKKHVFGALFSVLAYYLVDHFGFARIEHWSAYAIGIVLTLGFMYINEYSMIRVEIEGESVTIYNSGMVQGNIQRALITRVETVGPKGRPAIAISTSDALEYSMPIACFSEAEVEEMLKELRKA
jgi:hypothetical protein